MQRICSFRISSRASIEFNSIGSRKTSFTAVRCRRTNTTPSVKMSRVPKPFHPIIADSVILIDRESFKVLFFISVNNVVHWKIVLKPKYPQEIALPIATTTDANTRDAMIFEMGYVHHGKSNALHLMFICFANFSCLLIYLLCSSFVRTANAIDLIERKSVKSVWFRSIDN